MVRDLRMYLRQPAPGAALANVGRYVLEREERADDVWKQAKEASSARREGESPHAATRLF